MKYAIIRNRGRQFKVEEGEEIDFSRIDLKEGQKIEFSEVLLLVEGEEVEIGQPCLEDVLVEGKIISHFQGEKVRVATYKAKSRYRRVKGFRPQLTRVKIEKITLKTTRSRKTSS